MTDHDDDADGPLAELAGAVADGLEIDWVAARNPSHDPGHDGLMFELQTIASLSRVPRGNSDDPLEPAPTPPPAGDPPQPARRVHRNLRPPSPFLGTAPHLREVGRGSFGRVMRAWEPRLQREVALKLLDPVPVRTEETVVAEARLLAQIRHDNVVTVFGADCFDETVGFWMEFVEGRTLGQMYDQHGAFGAQEALLIAVDLCRALAAVHRAGFVHGDVKAQNVMRQVGGRIVLTDFGAARLGRDGRRAAIAPIVTPSYAAPEVLLGAAPTVQSDLYGVGVLLFYLVTGRFPVWGRTIEDFRIAHASGHRTLLRDLRPDLPPSFIRVVDAATSSAAGRTPGECRRARRVDRASGRARRHVDLIWSQPDGAGR